MTPIPIRLRKEGSVWKMSSSRMIAKKTCVDGISISLDLPRSEAYLSTHIQIHCDTCTADSFALKSKRE
jgi:hypothetical protein